MKDAYSKAAIELQGKARVGAVDCTAAGSEDLCTQRGIKGFPTLYIWPVSAKGVREAPVLFQGPRTKEGFVGAMLSRIPTFALGELSGGQLEGFLQVNDSNPVPKVLFFTEQNKPAFLWSGLAASFDGRIQMAWTSASNAGALGITAFPAAILLGKDGKRRVLVGVSELKYAHIHPLLNEMLAAPSALLEITSQEQLESACSESNGNVVCMIGFLALEPEVPESVAQFEVQLAVLQHLASKYAQIRFVWINPLKHFALGRKFAVSDAFPQVVLVKPKRKLYRTLNCAYEGKAIGGFVDDVLSGKIKVKEYSGALMLDEPAERQENKQDL